MTAAIHIRTETTDGETADFTVRNHSVPMLTVCLARSGEHKVALFYGDHENVGRHTIHVDPEFIESMADHLLDVATIVRRNRGENV